ncbi:hypothetical protein ACFFX0_16185 [Citricoccus parietis]|uniref:Uncharacterized protein n=1 Tax=Citricoccus parietis TaxID=592307 RepID=A0ABV5G143_9MICC
MDRAGVHPGGRRGDDPAGDRRRRDLQPPVHRPRGGGAGARRGARPAGRHRLPAHVARSAGGGLISRRCVWRDSLRGAGFR